VRATPSSISAFIGVSAQIYVSTNVQMQITAK